MSEQSPLTAAAMDPDNDEFATPPKIWRPLARAVDGFDTDPASGAEPTPIASTRYTKADDGLSKAWHGDVWLNPPWSTNGNGSAKERWLTKARNEAKRAAVDRVVVIIPSETSAHWFHEHVLAADAVCFVGPGRIPFQGEDRNPSFALVIAVFGPVDDRLADVLDSLGAVVRGRSIYESAPQATLGANSTGRSDDD
jgi:phage N-6-adenine-methyltransferase